MLYKDIWEEIKHKVSLVQEMEKHGLTLKKVGSRYACVCPFHADNDPSLTVNVMGEVETYHCFGCQKSGSVIDFIMNFRKLNYKETLEYFTNPINGYVLEWAEDVDLKALLENATRPQKTMRRRKTDEHAMYENELLPLSIRINRFVNGNPEKYDQISPYLKEIDEYSFYGDVKCVEKSISRLKIFMKLISSRY